MSWKKRVLFGAIILIPVLINITVAFKLWLKSPSEKDYFFYNVAYDFDAPDICEKIHPWAYERGGGFSGQPDIYYFRSTCYFDVALKLHNQDLCNRMRPLKTILWNDRGYKEHCFEGVRRGDPASLTDYLSRDDREKIMRLTGFSDYFRLKNGPPSDKEKFLEAVRKL